MNKKYNNYEITFIKIALNKIKHIIKHTYFIFLPSNFILAINKNLINCFLVMS